MKARSQIKSKSNRNAAESLRKSQPAQPKPSQPRVRGAPGFTGQPLRAAPSGRPMAPIGGPVGRPKRETKKCNKTMTSLKNV